MRHWHVAALLVIAGLVAGCASPTVPTARPSAPPTAPPITAVPDASATCPGLQFDPQASLGPEFDEESFLSGESEAIATAFVDGLVGLYAGEPDADPCALFTGTGLAQAAAADPRLGAALAGTSRLEADLVFRNAGEGNYDLRQRPPAVPVDVVFDIPAGSTTTDVDSGADDASITPQRVGLRVTFAYDGTRWLADRVERVPPADARWWALPSPIAELSRCKGFDDDPDRARFDDDAGGSGIGRDLKRPWCADGGDGPSLDELVGLQTRWPCGEARIAVLSFGLPLGTPSDSLDHHEYIRDPAREAAQRGWLHEPWTRNVELPDDADDTGWTNGNMDLWISPSEVEAAVYVRTGGAFERWPRGDDPSVTDCN